jgi:hypothetical protein
MYSRLGKLRADGPFKGYNVAVGVGVVVGVSVGVNVGVKVGGGWATASATCCVSSTTLTCDAATHTEAPLTQQTSYQVPSCCVHRLRLGYPGRAWATSGY